MFRSNFTVCPSWARVITTLSTLLLSFYCFFVCLSLLFLSYFWFVFCFFMCSNVRKSCTEDKDKNGNIFHKQSKRIRRTFFKREMNFFDPSSHMRCDIKSIFNSKEKAADTYFCPSTYFLYVNFYFDFLTILILVFCFRSFFRKSKSSGCCKKRVKSVLFRF